jgi:spore germination cell wall hydrolase CwlJ-like protein
MLPPITDAQWLALTVWLEAGGEPLEGQYAVAWTIANRARRRRRPLVRILFQPYQFSCWNTESPGRMRLDQAGDSVAWGDATAAATSALEGLGPDPSHNADHYLNVALTKQQRGDGSLPAWAEDPHHPGEVDPAKVRAIIGRHTFLRVP